MFLYFDSPANIQLANMHPIKGHTYSSIITLADNISYPPLRDLGEGCRRANREKDIFIF